VRKAAEICAELLEGLFSTIYLSAVPTVGEGGISILYNKAGSLYGNVKLFKKE